MSSRQRHLEKQALRRKEREKEKRTTSRRLNRVNYHPKLIVLALALAALVLIAILAPRTTDYVSCSSGGAEAQHFHPYIFIQIGEGSDLTVKFIHVPTSMGIRATCVFPIHVHEGAGARGPDFTLIHVESSHPLSEHTFTLGDAFKSWGDWLNGAYYIGPDGVTVPRDPTNPTAGTSFSGPTEVRTASDPAIMSDPSGPWNTTYGWSSQPASPNIQLSDGLFIHVWIHCVGC